jgi:preprotein translocase subunit SecF
MISISVFGLISWGLPLGVDFQGGTIIEYKFENEISTEDYTKELEEKGVSVSAIQSTGPKTYLLKLPPVDEEQKLKIASVSSRIVEEGSIEATASAALNESTLVEELRFETVGPSVGPELVKKTIYAIAIAAGAIMLWVAYQFKSIKFGTSAILAMLHDSFILVGSFAVLGYFMDAEVDFLFVTALLTTLSFSVHDTIVVYDRIREYQKEYPDNMYDLANKAITETMVRSLNNSFTIMFMLAALMLLGGTTVKWFAAALFIGTVLGTYSSPFVAVPLLVTWDSFFVKLRRGFAKLNPSVMLGKVRRK